MGGGGADARRENPFRAAGTDLPSLLLPQNVSAEQAIKEEEEGGGEEEEKEKKKEKEQNRIKIKYTKMGHKLTDGRARTHECGRGGCSGMYSSSPCMFSSVRRW